MTWLRSHLISCNPARLFLLLPVEWMLCSDHTDACVCTFILLSGLLSYDYVDVTRDGITEDDLGEAAIIIVHVSLIKMCNQSEVCAINGCPHDYAFMDLEQMIMMTASPRSSSVIPSRVTST